MKKLFLAVLFLVGCDQGGAQQYDVLQYQMNSTNSRLDKIEERLASLEYAEKDIAMLKAMTPARSAEFSPKSTGHQIVMTDHGLFYLSINNIEKYADGYRVDVLIGNPNTVTIKEAEIEVEYNSSAQTIKNWAEWMGNMKTATQTISTPIKPGSWQLVSVVLSPAKEDETGYLRITLKTQSIWLIGQ